VLVAHVPPGDVVQPRVVALADERDDHVVLVADAVVRRIPRGRVATYGQVALVAGAPRAARQVGYALSALRGTRHRIPWQRVLGARSRALAAISILDPMGSAVQRALLEAEGVLVDERGRVPLDRFGWKPRGARTR
jgi:methylated-DNA-protein-cysteine methyltransferase-like protein